MKCDAFEDRLNELLDERRHPESDAPLIEHVRRCAGCRETLAAHEALFDGLESRNLPSPEAALAERVVAALPERRSIAGTVLKWGLPLGLAAALLLALRPLLLDAPPPAAPTPPAETIVDGAPVAAQPDQLAQFNDSQVNDSQEQYLTMIRMTGHAMATLPNTVRRVATPANDNSPVAPLTNSFSAALDALRRTLPSKTSPIDGESQS